MCTMTERKWKDLVLQSELMLLLGLVTVIAQICVCMCAQTHTRTCRITLGCSLMTCL